MKDVGAYLISKGVKPSHQRIVIFQYLDSHHTHPTVDEVYAVLHLQMPTLSKTTIYNTLKLFEEKGVIQVVGIDEKNARLDAVTAPHAHFMCLKCRCVYDVPLSPKLADISREIIDEGRFSDFSIQTTQIYLKGICPDCGEKE